MRGGTANCTVAISDEEIASPVASSPEFVVAMNQPSAVKFQHHIQSGGVFFLNSSLVEAEIMRGDIEIVRVPANKIAEDLGSPRAANMVMLGAFTKKSGLVELPDVLAALRRILSAKKKLVDINEKALKTGYNLF